ncbi:MAG: hypothetical protein QM654_14895 [Dysgonamonadaceae bacterium]
MKMTIDIPKWEIGFVSLLFYWAVDYYKKGKKLLSRFLHPNLLNA